jgi:hypothetical protein
MFVQQRVISKYLSIVACRSIPLGGRFVIVSQMTTKGRLFNPYIMQKEILYEDNHRIHIHSVTRDSRLF